MKNQLLRFQIMNPNDKSAKKDSNSALDFAQDNVALKFASPKWFGEKVITIHKVLRQRSTINC